MARLSNLINADRYEIGETVNFMESATPDPARWLQCNNFTYLFSSYPKTIGIIRGRREVFKLTNSTGIPSSVNATTGIFGGDGYYFCRVGNDIYRSTDGVTWSLGSTLANTSIWAGHIKFNGADLIFGSTGATFIRSTDNFASNSALGGPTGDRGSTSRNAATNGSILVVGRSDATTTTNIFTSTTGLGSSFTGRSTNFTGGIQDVCYSTVNSTFYALPRTTTTGTVQLEQSTDGINWTTNALVLNSFTNGTQNSQMKYINGFIYIFSSSTSGQFLRKYDPTALNTGAGLDIFLLPGVTSGTQVVYEIIHLGGNNLLATIGGSGNDTIGRFAISTDNGNYFYKVFNYDLNFTPLGTQIIRGVIKGTVDNEILLITNVAGDGYIVEAFAGISADRFKVDFAGDGLNNENRGLRYMRVA